MPDISITQKHQLSHAAAKSAAQEVADKLAEKFDMTTAWNGDVLSFHSNGVAGTLTVYETEAKIEIVLGMFFKFFKDKLEKKVVQNMEKIFSGIV